MLLPSGYRQNPLPLAGAKVTLKAIHWLPPEVKPFPAISLEELTVGWAPAFYPSSPEPILQLCGGLGPSPRGLLLGTRVPTQGNRWARDVLSLEKRDFIAAVSTYKQTHPPRFPQVGKTKRRVGM